jgi:hypothetical protein
VVAGGLIQGTVSGLTVNGSLDIASGGAATGLGVAGLANPGDTYHQGIFVSSGGSASAITVGSAGFLEIQSGASAASVTVQAGGQLVVDGALVVKTASTLSGTLGGGGTLTVAGGGDLVLRDAGAGFTGQAVLSSGTLELARSGVIAGGVAFAAAAGSTTLQIDLADAPKAGGTFANVISNFSRAGEAIDLTGLAYHAGASATPGGGTLTLTEAGKTYAFTLAGTTAAGYTVKNDGAGGTLIIASTAALAQAMAAFSPAHAAHAIPATGSTASAAALLVARHR